MEKGRLFEFILLFLLLTPICGLLSQACYYGMQIEAVQDRIRDGISLDQMSRVLVDVQSDSSTVVDTIITKHQLDLMQLIFRNDEENRTKFKLVVANEIVPHLLAEEYMDKGEYENELRQVIGDTKTAYDISEHDVLIFGDERSFSSLRRFPW